MNRPNTRSLGSYEPLYNNDGDYNKDDDDDYDKNDDNNDDYNEDDNN